MEKKRHLSLFSSTARTFRAISMIADNSSVRWAEKTPLFPIFRSGIWSRGKTTWVNKWRSGPLPLPGHKAFSLFPKAESVLLMASPLCFPHVFFHFGILLLCPYYRCPPLLASFSTQMDSMVQPFSHGLVHSIKAYENTSCRCKFSRHQASTPHFCFTNLGVARLSIACRWILGSYGEC